VIAEYGAETGHSRRPHFVVQEHRARHLHYDFRLEVGGVLRSWAVPKGVPTEPGVRHLAVQVEDHPLSYIDFEGTIPKGQYGAGTVRIWDQGTYAPRKFEPNEIEFVLHGARLRGSYVLVRMESRPQHWLLMKLKEQSA
jgi:bifunctional non-homologous end joining protein LigD